MFNSKIEVYIFSISELIALNKKYNSPIIKKAIFDIRVFVENHEQDIEKLTKILQSISPELLEHSDKFFVDSLTESINKSSFERNSFEKFENPLGRRFESQIQIELLKNPTTAMMSSVQDVSKSILQLIEHLEKKKDSKRQLKILCHALMHSSSMIGFGGFSTLPNIKTIKQILRRNAPSMLPEIMHIHFKFSQNIVRNLNVDSPNIHAPVGELATIIENYKTSNGSQPYKDNPSDFFREMDRKRLSYIADDLLYRSALYNAEEGRGRKGGIKDKPTSTMGLMLPRQNSDGLPTHSSVWVADAKAQEAKLDSLYVRDLIENDAVYVAGPSGMTSLFLGQMECIANFPSVEKKQNYLAAVTAYMVGGGFHSLHEVIGPAEYALKLIPGYNIQVPQQNQLAPPPNYHQFYKQQSEIDKEFSSRIGKGWQKLVLHYRNNSFPRHLKSPNERLEYRNFMYMHKKATTDIVSRIENNRYSDIALLGQASLTVINEAKKLVVTGQAPIIEMSKIVHETQKVAIMPTAENVNNYEEYTQALKVKKTTWIKKITGCMSIVAGIALGVASIGLAVASGGTGTLLAAAGLAGAAALVTGGFGIFSLKQSKNTDNKLIKDTQEVIKNAKIIKC